MIMQVNFRKAELPGPYTDEGNNCWQEIANDPKKLGYWKKIAQLWKESLSVDVRQLKNIEESSFNNSYRSS